MKNIFNSSNLGQLVFLTVAGSALLVMLLQCVLIHGGDFPAGR